MSSVCATSGSECARAVLSCSMRALVPIARIERVILIARSRAGAAMIDHLGSLGLEHLARDGRGPRNAQVLLLGFHEAEFRNMRTSSSLGISYSGSPRLRQKPSCPLPKNSIIAECFL